MAKFERVKVDLRGRVRMLSPRALEIATKHFGAKRQSAAAKEVPVELLVIPPKREIIKHKEVPASVITDEVIPVEAKVIEPAQEVKNDEVLDDTQQVSIPRKGGVKKGTKKAKK